MADIDVVLQRGAREFYDDVATSAERLLINRALADLCEDPAPDDRTKFTLPESILYTDQRIWILYEMLNAFTISVRGIGTVD
jgi:hypothetical protein